MSAANQWDVPLGDNAIFQPFLMGQNGKAITTYTGSEPVRVTVWPGESQAAIAGVASITFDATQALTGQTTVTILGAGTASLTRGYYLVRCEIQLAGAWYEYYTGWLNLKDTPGTTAAALYYCSLQDMLDKANAWLPSLMSSSGLANFATERAEARNEINQVILSRNRPWGWAWISSGYISPYTSEIPDTYLQGLLATGKLIITPEIVQSAAYLSLALVCEQQLTWDKNDTFFTRLGFYRAKYQQAITSTVAQIDTNADGIADIVFNLGRFSIR